MKESDRFTVDQAIQWATKWATEEGVNVSAVVNLAKMKIVDIPGCWNSCKAKQCGKAETCKQDTQTTTCQSRRIQETTAEVQETTADYYEAEVIVNEQAVVNDLRLDLDARVSFGGFLASCLNKARRAGFQEYDLILQVGNINITRGPKTNAGFDANQKLASTPTPFTVKVYRRPTWGERLASTWHGTGTSLVPVEMFDPYADFPNGRLIRRWILNPL